MLFILLFYFRDYNLFFSTTLYFINFKLNLFLLFTVHNLAN
jgi:hypothetical protein